MKLLTRSTLAFLAYAGVVLLGGTFVFYFVMRGLNQRDVDEALTLRKQQVQRQLATLQASAGLTQLLQLDPDLTLRPAAPGPVAADYFSDVMGYDSFEHEAIPQRQLVAATTYQGQPYRLLLRRSLVENDELLSGIATAQALLLALLLGGMLILQAALNRRLWQPFYRTLAQLRHFRLDQLAGSPPTFAPTTTHEFRELNTVLTRLLAHSQRTYRSQREFTENAAHELQTPLSVLRSKLELLLQTPSLTAEQAGYADAMLAATSRLARLNRNLLLLARLDNQAPAHPPEILDLTAAVQAHLGQLREQFDAVGLTLHLDLATVSANIPRALLDSLLSNLLSNAIRHNTPGGEVFITLVANTLIVENTGRPQPLPAGQEFARFRRSADSAPGGVGLGLAIAQQICQSLNWTLIYEYPTVGRHNFTVNFGVSSQ